MRASKYAVLSTNTYRDDKGLWRFLYITRTASLVKISRRVARAWSDQDWSEIPDEVVAELREAGAIVPSEEDETASVLRDARVGARDVGVAKVALLPTSYCNMGCSYCGQQHSRGGLTYRHRDRVRARVVGMIERSTTRRVDLDWFGAEPMVGYPVIRDLSQSFVSAAERAGKRYRATIITNGSLLTAEKVKVLVEDCRVDQIDVTLDGPAHIHDRHRPLKQGGGSFDGIVRTLREVVAEPQYQHVIFHIRTNVDRHNESHVGEYLDLMAEMGFNRPNVEFSIFPVHSWGNDVSDVELERRALAEREIGWLQQMVKHGMRCSLLPKNVKGVVCMANHAGSEIISSTGNVFSCTEYPLVPEAERDLPLFNINDDELPEFRPAGPFDDWQDTVERGETWCKECTFLPVCGGSCPKAWVEGNPPCPTYKFNFEERMDLWIRRRGFTRVEGADGSIVVGAMQ